MRNWSPSSEKPLTRLQVKDGLLINKDLWNTAHNYHSRRQNIHYQAVNQPGIVYHLGVRPIESPKDKEAQYKDKPQDRRWLEIQPGMAIDISGNCIIVDEGKPMRIGYQIKAEESKIIYLVIIYKDPDDLIHASNPPQENVIIEQFIIYEKVEPPNANEVELCRIILKGDKNAELILKVPDDIFSPQDNELDFRYRPQVKWRAPSIVRAAVYQGSNQAFEVFCGENSPEKSNLSYLLQSLASLYPALGAFLASNQSQNPNFSDYDLIYITPEHLGQISQVDNTNIKEYLKTGGVILIEDAIAGRRIGELVNLKQEFQQMINHIELRSELEEMKQKLSEELQKISKKLQTEIQDIANFYDSKLDTNLKSLDQLEKHPLQEKPFLFSTLPSINKQPISILSSNGVIIVLGNLSLAWKWNNNLFLSRETIRSAQELGINILYFAWCRKYLTQLPMTVVKK